MFWLSWWRLGSARRQVDSGHLARALQPAVRATGLATLVLGPLAPCCAPWSGCIHAGSTSSWHRQAEDVAFRGECEQDLYELLGNLRSMQCRWRRVPCVLGFSMCSVEGALLCFTVDDDGPGIPRLSAHGCSSAVCS